MVKYIYFDILTNLNFLGFLLSKLKILEFSPAKLIIGYFIKYKYRQQIDCKLYLENIWKLCPNDYKNCIYEWYGYDFHNQILMDFLLKYGKDRNINLLFISKITFSKLFEKNLQSMLDFQKRYLMNLYPFTMKNFCILCDNYPYNYIEYLELQN